MKPGRKLEIGFAKDGDAPADPEANEAHFERKVKFLAHHLERSIVKVGLVVGLYVVLDTARQVVVKGIVPSLDN